MKTRTIIMCCCAVIFATASAFSTAKMIATPAWVLGTSVQNPNLHCISTDAQCEDAGAVNCRVSVFVGSTLTVTNGRKGPAFQCAIMKHPTAIPIPANPSETLTSVAPLVP